MEPRSESFKATDTLEKHGLFKTTQQLFAMTQARRAVFFYRREPQDRSSEQERKVNALALRAEEGRDNLRKAAGSWK